MTVAGVDKLAVDLGSRWYGGQDVQQISQRHQKALVLHQHQGENTPVGIGGSNALYWNRNHRALKDRGN